MTRAAVRLAILVGGVLTAACGSPAPVPAPMPPAPRPVTAVSPAQELADTTKSVAPALASDGTKYDPKGRRDPFVAVQTRDGSTSTVSTARLAGIVNGGGGRLALVETPDGLGYILKPGDTLGDGRLVEIGQNTAVFAVAAKPGTPSNRVVLRLPID